MDEANAFALEVVADYNGRFAEAPQNGFNAHRALLPTEVLDEIFTWRETRKLNHSGQAGRVRTWRRSPD